MRARRVFGWILFVWGILGILADIALVVAYPSVATGYALPGRVTICIVFIIGGWKLKQSAKVAQ